MACSSQGPGLNIWETYPLPPPIVGAMLGDTRFAFGEQKDNYEVIFHFHMFVLYRDLVDVLKSSQIGYAGGGGERGTSAG